MEVNPITIKVQINGKEESFKLDTQNPVKAGLEQKNLKNPASRSIFQSDIIKTYDSTDYSSQGSISYGKKNGIFDIKEQSVLLKELAKIAGDDKVIDEQTLKQFVAKKFGKNDTDETEKNRFENHKSFFKEFSAKQVQENPALGVATEAPKSAKTDAPEIAQGKAHIAQGRTETAQAKAPATPAKPAKTDAPEIAQGKAHIAQGKAETAQGRTETVALEPKNQEVTVDKWGAKTEKGKLANDCLDRIVKNNYPEIKAYSKEYNALMNEIAIKNPEAFGKSKNGKPNLNLMKTGAKIELPVIDKKTGKTTEAPMKSAAENKAESAKTQGAESREDAIKELAKAIKENKNIRTDQYNALNDVRGYITKDNAEKLQKTLTENTGQPITLAMRDAIKDAEDKQDKISQDLGFMTNWSWNKSDAEKTAIEALRIALVEEGLKPDSKEYQERVSATQASIKQAEVARVRNLNIGYGFGH